MTNVIAKNRRLLSDRIIMGTALTRCDARTGNENVR
jgi:hypothetical protein